MKTLADLKRTIKEGVSITLIETSQVGHKYLNIPRKVTRTQTNWFYAGTEDQIIKGLKGSFCDYPKSEQIKLDDNTFEINDDSGMRKYKLAI